MAASKKSQPTPTRTFPNTPAGTRQAQEFARKHGDTAHFAKGVNTGKKK